MSIPTKSELRERRRAERIAAERAARRRRIGRLGGVAVAAALLVAVAAIAASSGGTPAAPAVPAAGAQAAALVRGIPEHGGVLGDPEAPITVTEYLDLQCPICAAASQSLLPALLDDYVRTGKVKLEARTLHFIGPDSVRAARVAAGAERQGRLWPFLEAFYAAQGKENSGYVTDAFLRGVARAAGVDANAALAASGGSAARAQLDRANADARRLGIDSTPTFTLAHGSGRPQVLDAQELLPALGKATA